MVTLTMGNTYIGNAFSIQMLTSFPCQVSIIEVAKEDIPSNAISVVGHADTANVLGVAFNRVSLKLKKGDVLYVAQVVGGRLPEGATTLPEGFTMKFFCVELA